MIAPYRLPATSFDALASGLADPTGLAILRSSQLSKHLQLFRLFIDELRGRGGSAGHGSLDQAALDLLIRIDREHPAAVRATLSYPYVGSWLARCVRELRATDSISNAAHLTAVAAAAAARADQPTTLPAGDVSLPGLGRARIVDGHILVPAARSTADARWRGLTTLESNDRVPVRIILDYSDPYRDAFDMTVAPELTPEQVADWRRLFQSTWKLLEQRHRPCADEVAATVTALTPLAADSSRNGRSATSRTAFGAVAVTLPADPLSFAVLLCHEVQHAKLYALLDLLDLYRPDDELYYAPWRSDPRPVGALLNGAYAFLGVARFWHREQVADPTDTQTQFELVRTIAQLDLVLPTLMAAPGLTDTGQRFVEGMARGLASLPRSTASPRVRELAMLAVDLHRVAWHVTNIVAEPPAVRRLADAWQEGAPAPSPLPRPRLLPTAERFASDRRIALVARTATWSSGPSRAAPPKPGDGDALLAKGDYAGAAAAFRAALRREATNLDAWTGLAVAQQRTAAPVEAQTWRQHASLILALNQELRRRGGEPADPAALAGWLATSG